MDAPPWSAKQLRRLGESIRDETEPQASVPSYDDVIVYYNELAAETQEKIRGLDWASLLDDRPFEVTSRPKTIDTLRQKLRRDRATPLSNIQDVAGVRFEAEMSLDEQDAVATAIAGVFEHELGACLHDLRANPHSGYRAVHLWLRVPARVEVQIRTHMQSSWANMYESAADVLGRNIRYGELPEDPKLVRFVTDLQGFSVGLISQLEDLRNKILPLETEVAKARHAGQGEAGGRRGESNALRRAEQLERTLAKRKALVRESEESIRAEMGSLKATFDSLRDTRKR